MITKETVVDQITVTEHNTVFYRETTLIMEDGKELTKTYHRTSLAPGQNISNAPQKVQDICNMLWTPEVVAAYQAQQEAAALNRP